MAMNHLTVVNVIGEAWATSVLATTKFPPHRKLVTSIRPIYNLTKARNTPLNFMYIKNHSINSDLAV